MAFAVRVRSLTLLVAMTVLVGCHQETLSTSIAEGVATFPVAAPTTRDAVIEREYVAEVRASRYAEVRARLKGILETVAVDEGQHVKAGQLLFAINAGHLGHELAAAKAAILGVEAELVAAELELQNTQLLLEKDVVSSAELGRAQAKVNGLKAKVQEWRATADRASVELGYARITAPFDGVVNRLPSKVGSAVVEEALLTTIADTREVLAYFRVSEREYLSFGPGRGLGREVGLRLADGSLFSQSGTVDAVENEFDQDTGSIALRAKFPNPAEALKQGSSGKVVLRTVLPNALLVPQKATFDVQGSLYVFVVDGQGIARARRIGIKTRLGDAFVLESGLSNGDRFVAEGVQKVKDGSRIRQRSQAGTEEG